MDDAEGKVVPHASVREEDVRRIALRREVGNHGRRGRDAHDRDDERDGRSAGEDEGLGPQPAAVSPLRAALQLGRFRVEADELRRSAEPCHHIVAGVNAQPAADAAHLKAVADVDAGRADRHAARAVDAVPAGAHHRPDVGGFPDERVDAGLRGGEVGSERNALPAAGLAAPGLVGDDQALAIEERRLETRPRAHVEAHPLARIGGEEPGRARQDENREIGRSGRSAAEQPAGEGGRVDEVGGEGDGGSDGDHDPDQGPGRALLRPAPDEADDQPIEAEIEIRPHRLGTGEAAPDAAGDHRRGEQGKGGADEQPDRDRQVLWPELKSEDHHPTARQVDHHGLSRQARPAIPAQPGGEEEDGEEHRRQSGLDRPEAALDAMRYLGPVEGARTRDVGGARDGHQRSPPPRVWTKTASIRIVVGSSLGAKAGITPICGLVICLTMLSLRRP